MSDASVNQEYTSLMREMREKGNQDTGSALAAYRAKVRATVAAAKAKGNGDNNGALEQQREWKQNYRKSSKKIRDLGDGKSPSRLSKNVKRLGGAVNRFLNAPSVYRGAKTSPRATVVVTSRAPAEYRSTSFSNAVELERRKLFFR